mmetsp:Transcript_45541/g.75665  ORF Transcript_45541/g.75665 Transcript_45541/m.75665 type:complete len:84 (-) Transcript_45541:45-296(-)
MMSTVTADPRCSVRSVESREILGTSDSVATNIALWLGRAVVACGTNVLERTLLVAYNGGAADGGVCVSIVCVSDVLIVEMVGR